MLIPTVHTRTVGRSAMLCRRLSRYPGVSQLRRIVADISGDVICSNVKLTCISKVPFLIMFLGFFSVSFQIFGP